MFLFLETRMFLFRHVAAFLLISESWCLRADYDEVRYNKTYCKWQLSGTLSILASHTADLLSYRVGQYQLCTIRLGDDCKQTSGDETCTCTTAKTSSETKYYISIVALSRRAHSNRELMAGISSCKSNASSHSTVCQRTVDQRVIDLSYKEEVKPRCKLDGREILPMNTSSAHDVDKIRVHRNPIMECCVKNEENLGIMKKTLTMDGRHLFTTDKDNCLWSELNLSPNKNIIRFSVRETVCAHEETLEFAYGIFGMKAAPEYEPREKDVGKDTKSEMNVAHTILGIALLVMSLMGISLTCMVAYDDRKQKQARLAGSPVDPPPNASPKQETGDTASQASHDSAVSVEFSMKDNA